MTDQLQNIDSWQRLPRIDVPTVASAKAFIKAGGAGAMTVSEPEDNCQDSTENTFISIPETKTPMEELMKNPAFWPQLVQAFCQTHGIAVPAERTGMGRFKVQVVKPSPFTDKHGNRILDVLTEFTHESLAEATYRALLRFMGQSQKPKPEQSQEQNENI